jgi:hypothetical protein
MESIVAISAPSLLVLSVWSLFSSIEHVLKSAGAEIFLRDFPFLKGFSVFAEFYAG